MEVGLSDTCILVGCSDGILVGIVEGFSDDSDIIEGNTVGNSDVCNRDILGCVVGSSEGEMAVFPVDVLVGIVEDWFLDDSDIIEGDIVGTFDRLDCAIGSVEDELVVLPINVLVGIVED